MNWLYHSDIFSCLHAPDGQQSILDGHMFFENITFLHQIDGSAIIPQECKDLSESNHEKCNLFFKPTNHPLFLCINNKVYATGDKKYRTRTMDSFSLSFMPTQILDSHFPIFIQNKTMYKKAICPLDFPPLLFYGRFMKFHVKNTSFLFDPYTQKMAPAETTFIHTTINKLKSLNTDEIHEQITSPSFIGTAIFVLCLIFLVIFILCCSGTFVLIMETIFKLIIRFFRLLYSRIYVLIQYLINNIRDSYFYRNPPIQVLLLPSHSRL